nr:C1 family peptidase [Paenibacillus oenotherae]
MSAVLPAFAIPPQFEVENITPVKDQDTEGTCVGFACTIGMKEWQEQKEQGSYIALSPRYLYEKTKAADQFPDGNPRCSPGGDGTSISVAMRVLQHNGVCEESFWPYKACETSSPGAGADENAGKYRIKAYARLDSLDTMKRSLLVNGPFVIGVTVYENWRNPEVGATGKIPMPSGRIVGGHALCVVGYNDHTGMLKFKNSWSTSWGDGGFGYLPYSYIDMDENFEAYSGTDLIDNVDALVKAKEKVLTQMNESFTEEVKINNWGGEQKIQYH